MITKVPHDQQAASEALPPTNERCGSQLPVVDRDALLDELVDGVVVGDSENRIEYVNAAAQRLLGWQHGELVGMPLTTIVPERLHGAHLRGFSRYLETREPHIIGRAVRVPARRRDDREVEVELTLSAIETAGAPRFVAVLRDVANRVELPGDAAVATRLVEVLAAGRSLSEAGPRMLAALGEGLGWPVAAFWVADPDEQRLRFVALWHHPDLPVPRFEAASRRPAFAPRCGLPGRVWAAHEPLWIDDVRADPNFPRAAAAAADGLGTGFAFPILADGKVQGVIELFAHGRRAPEPLLVDRMQSIGRHLGQFIQRTLADEQLAISRQRLDLALTAGRLGAWEWDVADDVMTWSHTLTSIVGLPADSRVGTLETYLAWVHPQDRDRAMADIRRAVEERDTCHIDHRVVLPDGTVRWVEIQGHVLPDEAGRLVLAAVTSDVTERKRVEEREREARVALERSQQRLAFLSEASGVLGSSLNYQVTLGHLARLSVPTLADACVVHIRREDETISPLASAHADPEKEELLKRMHGRFPASLENPEGVGRAMRTNESVIYHELGDEILEVVARDEEHLRILRELGLRSAMIVPLVARGRTLGTLTLLMTDSGRRYEDLDVALGEEVARRAALAVDNSRLYSERSRVARALQRSLLPPQLPHIAGMEVAARYEAAGEGQVGGDFYDVFPIPRDGWALVIGDVRGKGHEAAAVTALARHTVRAATFHSSSPAQILMTLNEAMLQREEEFADGRFCTVAFAELEPRPDGAHLTVASGGHPLPLVVRTDGTVKPVGGAGMLVGAFPDARFDVERVQLHPGDLVVFYTDGVIEARVDDELFGEERLRLVVSSCAGASADEVARRIEAAVTEFSPALRDDLAIVALRVGTIDARRPQS